MTQTAKIRTLLSSNTKLQKSPMGSPIINAGLSMAPHMRSGLGVNVCENASPFCIAACVLWFAGRTVMASVRNAAIERTALWYQSPAEFYKQLSKEIESLIRRAKKNNARAYLRLNVGSDIDHRDFSQRFAGFDIVAKYSDDLTVYDYTKRTALCEKYNADSVAHHLTYSVSEKTTFDQIKRALAVGNVAMVVNTHYQPQQKRFGYLPENYIFRNTATGELLSAAGVDGDSHDIRTPNYDGQRGAVVGLRLKGTNKAKKAAVRGNFAKSNAIEDFDTTGGARRFLMRYGRNEIGGLTCDTARLDYTLVHTDTLKTQGVMVVDLES